MVNTDIVEGFLERAIEMVPGITTAELAVAATAWLRIQLDGEPEGLVVSWARKMLGIESNPGEIRRLHEDGASVRQIAAITGVSKSRVARHLSQAPRGEPQTALRVCESRTTGERGESHEDAA